MDTEHNCVAGWSTVGTFGNGRARHDGSRDGAEGEGDWTKRESTTFALRGRDIPHHSNAMWNMVLIDFLP